MGVLRPIVERAQSVNGEKKQPRSDRWFTFPNGMTLARPIIAGIAAYRLLRTEAHVSGYVMAAAASDMEGTAARLGDKFKPGSIWGSSTVGAEGDPLADTAMAIETAVAMTLSPRVSFLGRLSGGIIIAQEAPKAVWAINANNRYKAVTGKKLSVETTLNGKESMAEKLVAIGSGAATADLDNHPLIRFGAGAAAVGFALAGSLRAQVEFAHVYKPLVESMIHEAQLAVPSVPLDVPPVI